MENDMKVQRFDSLPLDATYFTDEGYLVDHPIVTSVGIFVYHNPDGSERRELRLPEEVFAEKSLASYKGKPIIVTHDAGYVDTDNVKEESIGTILSEGYRDGDDVRAEIIIHDTDSLKKYKMRELSCGYNLRLDETPGVWEGQPYDAIQRDIEIQNRRIESTATTVLKYVQDNIKDIARIVSCPELDPDSVDTNPYAAESDGKGVALLFKNDPRKFTIENPLSFMQYPVQPEGLEMVVPCEARTAGAIIYYPMSMLIATGIC